MAAFTFPADAASYTAGVLSIVPAVLDAGADNHQFTLGGFFAEDSKDVAGVGYIIESLGISLDTTDDCTITVTDPDSDGPSLVIILSGATATSYRQLAGEWFPQGTIIRIATTTGVGVRIRLSVREDKEG